MCQAIKDRFLIWSWRRFGTLGKKKGLSEDRLTEASYTICKFDSF